MVEVTAYIRLFLGFHLVRTAAAMVNTKLVVESISIAASTTIAGDVHAVRQSFCQVWAYSSQWARRGTIGRRCYDALMNGIEALDDYTHTSGELGAAAIGHGAVEP